MTAIIVANGDLDGDPTWIESLLDAASLLIAADGGAQHLRRLGHRPDVVIGDLDSFDARERALLEEKGTRFLEHPRAKDETDLELALLYAVEHCEEPILVLAALGGRLDQMFANILLLMHPALRKRSLRFVTQYQQVWLTDAIARIDGEAGDTVSLIPLGGDVQVAETTGLQWHLQNDTLSFGPARGLSNVMLGQVASVRITSGYLLIVHTKKSWGR